MIQTHSPMAVSDVYDDLRDVIRGEAARHARARGLDAEECEADATLIFLDALTTHRRGGSAVGQWVRFRVRTGLRAQYRVWVRRNCHLPRVEMPADVPAVEPEPFDRDGFAAVLSAEAAVVLRLVLDTPAELLDAIRTDPEPSGRSIRKHLRGYLTGTLRWAAAEVAEAFEEIRGAL